MKKIAKWIVYLAVRSIITMQHIDAQHFSMKLSLCSIAKHTISTNCIMEEDPVTTYNNVKY